jgi:hypothetical protein
MSHRHARWNRLTLFALANLMCWIGLAVVAELAIGDHVNLGVETLLREGQATAVAAWKRAPQKALAPSTAAEAAAQVSSPAQADGQPLTETAEGGPAATVAFSAPLALAGGSEAIAAPAASMVSAAPSASSVPSGLTPEQPAVTLVSSPLALADPDIKSLGRLDAEMARSAPGRDVQIRYHEDALNREIVALWTDSPGLPFRNVRVDLKDGHVIVTGKTTVLGLGVNAKATCSLAVQDCLPRLQIESVSVAGVVAPEFVKERIAEMLLEAMTWYPANYPLCLEQIVLEEAQATVYGHCR